MSRDLKKQSWSGHWQKPGTIKILFVSIVVLPQWENLSPAMSIDMPELEFCGWGAISHVIDREKFQIDHWNSCVM